MLKMRGITGIVVNVALFLVIAALYAITAEPFAGAKPTIGSAVYMGTNTDAVALQWTLSYKAGSLDKILNTLESRNISSTFFISGEYVRRNPEQVRKIVSMGHEIGTLGDYPNSDGDIAWVEQDIITSIQSIKEICGITPRLYYSAARKQNVSDRAAKNLGITHVKCTIDLLCARDDAENIVLRARNAAGGNIILMQPTAQAWESLEELLLQFEEMKLEVVTTGELIGLYD